MYHFSEYFDTGDRALAYISPNEELTDYLKLLDMVLEEYMEFKGLHSEKKAFFKGACHHRVRNGEFFCYAAKFQGEGHKRSCAH